MNEQEAKQQSGRIANFTALTNARAILPILPKEFNDHYRAFTIYKTSQPSCFGICHTANLTNPDYAVNPEYGKLIEGRLARNGGQAVMPL